MSYDKSGTHKIAVAAGIAGGTILLVGLPIGLWAGGVIFSGTYNIRRFLTWPNGETIPLKMN